MIDKLVYNTVLSQALSPCGNFLVAGNIYGQLAVFEISLIFNPVEDLQYIRDFSKPKGIIQLEERVPISALVSTENFLIVGTVGLISAYEWKAVTSCKVNKVAWSINIAAQQDINKVDVNSLYLDECSETLYAGCGDNNIYKFRLEGGQLIGVLAEHQDYIHSVSGKNNTLITAGEDGAVKLWDDRTNKCHNTIEPHKNNDLNRPDLGKWIGAAALESDWIICGGGPRLALWHLRTLDVVNVMSIEDRGIHVASFLEENIIAGGACKNLYRINFSGQVEVELPVSATTVYSVLSRTGSEKFLSIAGSSQNIDLCTSFNYCDQILHFK